MNRVRRLPLVAVTIGAVAVLGLTIAVVAHARHAERNWRGTR
jgi:hypothetical protein